MPTKRIRAKWLRFTEESNALDYLERAAQFIRETERDRRAWKWVAISLHGALYGFAVCACKGTNYENVLIPTKKGHKRLVSVDKALQMCQDPKWMRMLIYSQPLVLSKSQEESIRVLKKELRNKIEHYIPCGWSIEIHGMPIIAIDVLDVIRFLAIRTGTFIHLNQAQMKKVKSCVFQGKRHLKKTMLYAEAKLVESRASKGPRNLVAKDDAEMGLLSHE